MRRRLHEPFPETSPQNNLRLELHPIPDPAPYPSPPSRKSTNTEPTPPHEPASRPHVHQAEGCHLIFAGTKTIELRRVCPKVGPGDLVLVYVSSPRMALVGGFEVAGIVSNEPQALCKKWQPRSGVEKETFLHYFHGAATAYGILIGRTWQFASATGLKALRRSNGGFHPPQSYRYVGSEKLVKLVD